MNEQKNNGRGIFYGVIGVATLVVAIIGATFAYFTASASDNNTITGNMATINLQLAVDKMTKVDETQGGMIPMSNGMVEQSLKSTKGICLDDNNNAVCQIYKITLTNDSSAGQFVDGYVALRDKFNIKATDIAGLKEKSSTEGTSDTDLVYKTNEGDYAGDVLMRWAQVFCTETEGTLNTCSTAGTQNLGTGADVTMTALGNTKDATDQDPYSQKDIRYSYEDKTDARGILQDITISGNPYKAIGTNYIRLSNRVWATEGAQGFDRASDASSALVFNHNIAANSKAEYYVVVWLSETGTNQTAGQTVGADPNTVTNPAANQFFNGNVTFVSAQGSEVSATFGGYTRVPSDTNA